MRADTLPLVISIIGAQDLPRGARVRVKLGAIDEITLDIHGTVIERLDDPLDSSDDAPLDDAAEDEDDVAAGPIAIAVDVNEADSTSADTPAP